jgi:glycosyltransferase involved in cell wall biosynthesis
MLTPQTPDEIKKDPRIRGWNGPGSKVIPPAKIVTLRIMDDVVVDPADPRRVATNYAMSNMADDIRRAREAGQIVLYDIDDDLWHIPTWSPAAVARHRLDPNVRATDLEVIDANINACDGVIVSTEYLQMVVAKEFPAVPVYVVRPGIDPDVYSNGGPDHPLRVGWMGSISHHLPHLRTMQIALEVLNDFDAEFMRLGWIRGDHSELLLGELPCKVGQMPWGTVEELPRKFLQIDAAIIPRVPTLFNESQSVTSGLQYAAAGIPFCVSPSAEYIRLEKMGVGRICRDIDDWRINLSELLEFDDKRREEAASQRDIVTHHFGLDATGRNYADLFEKLLADA